MKALFILNDAPYGSERTYNGLRLAGALAQQAHNEVHVFLMGDAVGAGKDAQHVPGGYYNIQLMLDRLLKSSAVVGLCGTCMDARGIGEGELVPGARRSTLDELRAWTEWADRVLVF